MKSFQSNQKMAQERANTWRTVSFK